MKNWKETLISPSTSIIESMKIIDNSSMQIALVVGRNGRLLGTVTDGDVRRGILAGVPFEDPVEKVMNPNPVWASIEDSRSDILDIMQSRQIHQIPLLDSDSRVVGLELMDEILLKKYRDNWVILMAGGHGTRLRPLTDDRPKPLLKIGGEKPILELILENCIKYGFHKFFFTVHYKSEMIKEYFGDGSRWNVDIQYIQEDKKLGTAGSLGLLPEKPSLPSIIMNGDLYTRINHLYLLKFHKDNNSVATMCIKEYHFQIPFGVVKIDKQRLKKIDEKPLHRFFINAGIYVLEPEVLKLIKVNELLDMTTLYERLIRQGLKITVFPIREDWMDIGNPDDFERAHKTHNQPD